MRLTLGIVLALTVTAANAQTVACLQERQVQGFDYKSDWETVAVMKNYDRFNVKFAGRCGYNKFHPQLSFDMTPGGECLMPGSILRSIDGGGCAVKEITPVSR